VFSPSVATKQLSPEKVLDELAFLEQNYDFPRLETSPLPRVTQDLEFAFIHVLHHLFSAEARGAGSSTSEWFASLGTCIILMIVACLM
jgi:hypothetical protein